MNLKDFQIPTNKKLHSFLHPTNKFGCRSLSLIQSQQQFRSSHDNHRSYIKFKSIKQNPENSTLNRTNEKQTRSFSKIGLMYDNKKENYEKQNCTNIKLIKSTIKNRFKQHRDRTSKNIVILKRNIAQKNNDDNNQSYELLQLVRQLKQKLVNLQSQNQILKQQHIKDGPRQRSQYQKIAHQGYQKLNNSQTYLGYSQKSMSSNTVFYDFTNKSKQGAQILRNYNINSKFGQKQLKKNKYLQADKVMQQYQFQQNHTTLRTIGYPIQYSQLNSYDCKKLKALLCQIEMQRQKQLQQIQTIIYGCIF